MVSRHILLCFSLIYLALPNVSLADQLFPPGNHANPNQPCSDGKVLSWTGKGVACGDPSPGVNVTACPPGQLIKEIKSGSATCITPPIPNITCANGQAIKEIVNGAPTCVSIAPTCPEGKAIQSIAANGAVTCVDIRPHTAGSYMVRGYPTPYGCRIPNPVTGKCTCPTGYKPFMSWDFNVSSCAGALHLYSDSGATPDCKVIQYTCYKN